MNILLIEDNPGDALLMREMLAATPDFDFRLETADRLSTGLARLQSAGADLVIVDLQLPDSSGLDTVRRVCDAAPNAPIIVLTGLDDEALALEAMRKGAQDYLVKGQVDERVLARTVRYAIERHRTLAVLRHQSRMQAVGQLTVGVAHEFNDLLTVIVANTGMLQSHLKGSPGLAGLADQVAAAADQGAKLTSSLLAFCRMQMLRPKLIELDVILHDLAILIGRTLGERTELKLNLPSGLWLAMVDAAQLQVALCHLIMNARDALATGGVIEVAAANLALDGDGKRARNLPPGEYVAITVSDNGAGMTPATLERAFEPFFSTKGVGKGTGLGLSMVYGFARQSGGDVQLASEAGTGTTATLILPATSEAVGSQTAVARDAVPRRTPAVGRARELLL